MLKIDRKAVDTAIEEMELYTATKEVLTKYEAEKEVLVQREKALAERLAQLQEQHTSLLIDREVATDNPSDYIYMSKQLTNVNEDVKIITSLQEKLKESYTELKQKYMPIIQENYKKDSATRHKHFNVSETVAYVRNELQQAISDYEKAIREQDQQVMPLIYDDFLDDSELMNEGWEVDQESRVRVLAFKRTFEFDRNKLLYDKEIKL
ncbi:hypothetical protein AB1I92_15670 [Bacillus mobilis]|uniref:Uncharacterized protein n=3 Tax=Bacillus cereus group TaxID=86661 RepID=A0A1C4EGI7_BACCE|nr:MULTISPECIES: hypothetical protein [Bacillus cereus group]OKA31974.1 hypothetical protein BJR06_28455 [Bacillus cereus]OKA32948.1 hypothetical protein BJR07_26920 [Bacillus cereus]SCC42723.1 Uncharacterized protein BC0861_04384 [Bacillus mobilis]